MPSSSPPREVAAPSWFEPSETVGIPEWFLHPKDPEAATETALAEMHAEIVMHAEMAAAILATAGGAVVEGAAVEGATAEGSAAAEAEAAPAVVAATEVAIAPFTAPDAEGAELTEMQQADAEAPSPCRMPKRARVSVTATGLLASETPGQVGPARARPDQKGVIVRHGKSDAVTAALGGGGGLAALAKLQAAGRTVTNTIKVKQIFVPPRAPPPPTMWATIKNEHLLVATFWSADANYAKVQKGESQLRETQLVQIVFNTLMFQLGLLSLLAWRFTDFETMLSGPMIFAVGTLAAFVSAAFTLLCKGVFRWGNIRRRKARKASRLHRLSRWVRSAAKEEGGVRVAVMKEWWHYRTSSLRRTPMRALPRMAVVVRQNLSWFLIFFAYFASLALVLVFGLTFEDVKYYSVLGGWAVSLGETWLLVEPSVVFIMIILPRLLDEAMTPVSAMSTDEKAARVRVKLARKRKRASLLIRQLEAPFNPDRKGLPFRGPSALISAVLKPKKSSAKYTH